MDNISQQSDEIEALKSIYEDQWVIENVPCTYSIQINQNIKLYISLSPNYPTDEPPNYDLFAPTLSRCQKLQVEEEFKRIFEENKGDPIIFQWIEKLKDISESKVITKEPNESQVKIDVPKETNEDKIILKNVTHGSIIVDRKSTFQGHACVVNEQSEIKAFMNLLLENKKIAQATHNISAYRLMTPNNVLHQDCDDDGETHAGGRLLHLLEIMNLQNVMVVVSRWYGGIHLGPDRFKHINNAARQVLLEGGFIKQ